MVLQSPFAPSLGIAKRASTDVLAPGGAVYTVTVAGRNPSAPPSGPSTLPIRCRRSFRAGRSSAATRKLAANGDDAFVDTWITPTTTPTYSFSLFVTATLPINGVCADGAPQINRAAAHAESCPECLAGGDSHILYVEDPRPEQGGGYFHVTSRPGCRCGKAPTSRRPPSALRMGSLDGTTYRDDLNPGGTVGPLNLVDGSVRVIVDDIDRTADVTVTAAPR